MTDVNSRTDSREKRHGLSVAIRFPATEYAVTNWFAPLPEHTYYVTKWENYEAALDKLDVAAARIATLEDENAQLRVGLGERDDDAERYRALFIRARDGSVGIPAHVGLSRVGEFDEPFSKAWFDREIDAALLTARSKA